MHKSAISYLYSIVFITSTVLLLSGCGTTDSDSDDSVVTLTIGTNLEMTGDLPEVGKASKQTIEMYLENLASSGGLNIDGVEYQIVTRLEDNKSTEEGALAAASDLISHEDVLAMIGPNTSYQAVPTGQLANESEIVMISPWSSDVETTLNRPWVFRVSFIDSFQGMALAQFAKSQLNAVNACLLYADDNAHPRGLAESFETEWVNLSGAVAARETFQTGEEDLATQLNRIGNAGCELLLLPQYANELPSIIEQIHEAGITAPVIGSDAWGNQGFPEECGSDCEGYFFVKQFDPSGATAGIAEEFVSNYQARYDEVPDDVAALTWDAMLLVEQSIRNCGAMTGELAADRACIRDGLATIQNLESVTGPISFNEDGDPIKCASITKIEDGIPAYFETVCPE